MSEIAKLNVVKVDRSGRAQPEVVEFIEGLLQRAQTGELQSVAVAWVRSNGRTAHGASYGERPDDILLMGSALHCLTHAYTCTLEESEIEAPPPLPPDQAG